MKRAGDSFQRRRMLALLDAAQTAPRLVSLAGNANNIVDLEDFTFFVRGYLFARKEMRPRIRRLELRCMPYGEYLETPEWKRRRDEQFLADGCRCRVCNSPKNCQVHHRSYEHRGDEQPGDLTTLCAACHQLFHSSRKLERVA